MKKISFLCIATIYHLFATTSPSIVDYNEYSMNTELPSQFFNRFDETTLNAFHIPVEYIATLQAQGRLIDVDTTKWRYLAKQFENGYEYIPILRKMLADAEVPQEFLFLAMAESEFKSQALSTKKAAGIWQLMPVTAKEMGLTIDDYIDERLDPIKSTQAAIKYLQYLYKATGKWYLAAMAYNCGLGRLNRAIQEAGSDNIEVLLDEDAQYLPLETRNYLRKIMSMSLAFSNAHELKQADKEYILNRGATDSLAIVNVKGGNSLANIAKGANMTLHSFRGYNQHFKYNFVPIEHKEYQVYIPYDKLSYFKQHFKDSYDIASFFVSYKVRKGDTLSSIARKYNISIAQIKKINALRSNHLSIHQKIMVPATPIKQTRVKFYAAQQNNSKNIVRR